MGESTPQNATDEGKLGNRESSAYPFDIEPFSDKQLMAIVALSEFPVSYKSYQDLADKLGVDRTTLFTWRNRPDFKAALSKMADWLFLNTGHLVRQGHLAACVNGNPQAIKLYYQKAEKWVEQTKVEHSGEIKDRHFKIRRVETGEDLTKDPAETKKPNGHDGATEAKGA